MVYPIISQDYAYNIIFVFICDSTNSLGTCTCISDYLQGNNWYWHTILIQLGVHLSHTGMLVFKLVRVETESRPLSVVNDTEISDMDKRRSTLQVS